MGLRDSGRKARSASDPEPARRAPGTLGGAAAQAEAERANAARIRFLATASDDLRQRLQSPQLLNAALRRRVSDAEARELLAREREAVDAMAGPSNSLNEVEAIAGRRS